MVRPPLDLREDAAPMLSIQSEQNPAESAGQSVGEALAWVADNFGDIGAAVGDFFHGVASGAGLQDPTTGTWIGLGLGGLLLVSGIADLLKGEIIAPVFKGVIGLGVLGWALS